MTRKKGRAKFENEREEAERVKAMTQRRAQALAREGFISKSVRALEALLEARIPRPQSGAPATAEGEGSG